jgi:RNA polymerase sigma factor (sigma-70 family)
MAAGVFDAEPGSQWSSAARTDVVRWLRSDPQHQELVRLGRPLLEEGDDVWDAWEDYFARRLDGVIETFDPASGATFFSHLARGAAPERVEAIVLRPASAWTRFERCCVVRWLLADTQLRLVLVNAVHHLGPSATWQDAEDAWADFCVPGPRASRSRLDYFIERFDPDRAPFWPALRFFFRRFCEGRRTAAPAPDGDGVVAGTQESEQLQRERRRDIERCLDRLPAKHGRALRLYYFEGWSVPEIAEMTGESVATVKKTRLFDGRALLRQMPEMQRWAV